MNARSSGVLLGDGFRLIDEELDLDDHHLLASKRCGWGASNFALELDAEPEQLDDRGHMLVGVGRCLADDNGEESTLHARLFACFVGAGGHSAILHDEVAASLGVKVVGTMLEELPLHAGVLLEEASPVGLLQVHKLARHFLHRR